MVSQERTYCLETFACPNEALLLPDADRRKVVEGITRVSPPGGFKENELANKASISLFEEAVVMLVLCFVMGGPLFLLPALGLGVWMYGWKASIIWLCAVLFLAGHPLPRSVVSRGKQSPSEFWLTRTPLALYLYKYFSYRFVWSGDAKELAEGCAPWIGAGPPHGVLPFANVLSIPAINTFCFVHFTGAGASVVPRTPFLRYMTLFGFIDVSGKTIAKALEAGTSVGTVPDGIAGIFRTNADDETVKLKHRKGTAKLALRTGRPIVPAYSVGNTAAFSAWFDRHGLLERISRKVQASFFVYWGRCFLPIPYRANITMLIGKPIVVEKVAEPTDAQVDEVHQRLLDEMEQLFNMHKAALGWGHKKIIFE